MFGSQDGDQLPSNWGDAIITVTQVGWTQVGWTQVRPHQNFDVWSLHFDGYVVWKTIGQP